MPSPAVLRLIGAGLTILLVILAITFGPAACTSLFTAKQEARTAKGQAGAMADAAEESGNTLSNLAASDAATDQIGKEGSDAIRNAPEGERGNVALDESCRLRLHKHKQRCAGVRQARPGQPAPAH